MSRAMHFGILAACAGAALAALAGLAPPARAGEAAAGGEGGEAFAEEFTSDLVVLKSDLAIEGRVVGRDGHSVRLLVEYGVLSIPRVAVKRIEYNLASRLKEIPADDHAARYGMLAQAVEEGNISQAKPYLEGLLRKPGVPQEIYKVLARVYESEGELEKALELWKKYSLAKPNDEEAKERIAELSKKLGVGPKVAAPAKSAATGKGATAGAQPAAGGQPVAKAAGEAPEKAAAGGAKVTEGLEAGGKWEVLNWGNPATVKVQPLDGNQVVMVEVPERGGKDKAAIQRQGRLDLSGHEKLAFRVFNGGKGHTSIAIALVTSRDYYESRTVRANPDWNLDLAVDLSGNQWKCKSTNWTFKAEAKGLDSVRQIIFLIYSGRRKALLYFDYIHPE